ncbi:hypothetical protein BD289DRAFT_449128 [Coniella lustricola]|uniref:Oxysterol-binding protein n=1 Tax=Coniella lustricola TaxID=2025994 RepID=A0A2T3ANS8_9PEZI|nr:hypothetical protein BD289DRAFT_449128 [Coniella lustricola]
MSTDASTKPQSSVTLKDFLASIASIRGDLSNITAPPFVLDTKSVVELPAFWAERPSFFVAPASSSDPAQRALLVLRWFLVSLKNQQYGGRSEQEGVKKPLNAFLGECFLARCQDETGDTMLVSEQVSHHPPVTACRLWNEKHGVSAEGFTRQEITLSLGSITIKQTGHALLTLSKFDKETYLIPLPNVKVKGVLSGLSGTYPELDGTYTIPSTTGYYSTVEFSGKSLLSGGHKNEVVAKLYAPGEAGKDPLYTVTGQWNDSFTIYEGSNDSKDRIVEVLRLADLPTVPRVPLEENLEAQDPWETRRAWHGVREALDNSDMTGAAKAKSVIEQGQRDMREDEKKAGSTWKPLFFKAETTDEIAARLYRTIPEDLDPDKTVAIWKFNHEFWDGGVKRPFHDTLTPDNRNNGEEFSTNTFNNYTTQLNSKRKFARIDLEGIRERKTGASQRVTWKAKDIAF